MFVTAKIRNLKPTVVASLIYFVLMIQYKTVSLTDNTVQYWNDNFKVQFSRTLIKYNIISELSRNFDFQLLKTIFIKIYRE